MSKITPFLWFDNNAEEAIDYYLSIFPDGKKGKVSRYGEAGPGGNGQFMTGTFTLQGQEFVALNGGPNFRFNEAVSFVIECKNQEEVDYYWNRFLEGGEESMCGWIKDRFGLWWQVVPAILPKMLSDPDPGRSRRVMTTMMPMRKLDIATLEAAYNS